MRHALLLQPHNEVAVRGTWLVYETRGLFTGKVLRPATEAAQRAFVFVSVVKGPADVWTKRRLICTDTSYVAEGFELVRCIRPSG